MEVILPSRLEMHTLIRQHGLGVEVGVDRGDYSAYLLEQSSLRCLYSVDPWEGDYASAYPVAVDRLAPFGARSKIIRCDGVTTGRWVATAIVDFVYIDSSHTYQETLAEIEAWWPTLSPGGILAGHDYCNGLEVQKAVNEFTARHGLKLYGTDDDQWPGYRVNSWILMKDEVS